MPKDLYVNVIMDKVYCQQNVQFSHGKFFGIENSHITKTLLVVMIKSVAGKYRDVVCMSPIHNLNSEKLLKVWNNVIRVVTKIGFDVVLTMVDGHQSILTDMILIFFLYSMYQ